MTDCLFNFESALRSNFWRARDDWRQNVWNDPQISSAEFVIAFLVSSFINARSHVAWPAQKTLAERARMTDRSVRSALVKLRDRGHLEITRPGRLKENRYHLRWRSSPPDERNYASGRAAPDERNYASGRAAPDERNYASGRAAPDERNYASGPSGSVVPPILKIEPNYPLTPQPDDLWQTFETKWHWQKAEARERAHRAFQQLDADQKQLAVTWAARFQGSVETVSARNYLRERLWRNLAGACDAASPQTPTFDLKNDSSPWGKARRLLAEEIGVETVVSWFAKSKLHRVEGCVVTLTVPTVFFRSHIAQHFSAELVRAWRRVDPSITRVDLVASQELAADDEPRFRGAGAPTVAQNLGSSQPPPCTTSHAERGSASVAADFQSLKLQH